MIYSSLLPPKSKKIQNKSQYVGKVQDSKNLSLKSKKGEKLYLTIIFFLCEKYLKFIFLYDYFSYYNYAITNYYYYDYYCNCAFLN